MKCYRLRNKAKPDEFFGSLYDTAKGARLAFTSANSYLGRYVKRLNIEVEVVEYDLVEIGTV